MDNAQSQWSFALGKIWEASTKTLYAQFSFRPWNNTPANESQGQANQSIHGFISLTPSITEQVPLFVWHDIKTSEPLLLGNSATILRKHLLSGRVKKIKIVRLEQSRFVVIEFAPEDFLILGQNGMTTEYVKDNVSFFRIEHGRVFTVRKPWTLGSSIEIIASWEDESLSQLIQQQIKKDPSSPKKDNTVKSFFSSEQRVIREKLNRRLKTLKKSLKELTQKIPKSQDVTLIDQLIQKVRSHLNETSSYQEVLFQLNKQMILVQVTTETSTILQRLQQTSKTTGQLLTQLYKVRDRQMKGQDLLHARCQDLERLINEATTDVSRLKSDEVAQASLLLIAKKYRLRLSTPLIDKRTSHGLNVSQSKPSRNNHLIISGRIFQSTQPQVSIHVGRDAFENDAITKKARDNDLWFHLVSGGQGAHVIVKSNTKTPISDTVKRDAAILAIHFSSLKNALEGEVYATEKKNLRKQKNLPPGKWIVRQSKTIKIRYTTDELAEIFSREVR